LIENIRTQHDDGTAIVLSVVLEATKTIEKKVKMENSGEPDSLLYDCVFFPSGHVGSCSLFR